jgi:hypothetical protein
MHDANQERGQRSPRETTTLPSLFDAAVKWMKTHAPRLQRPTGQQTLSNTKQLCLVNEHHGRSYPRNTSHRRLRRKDNRHLRLRTWPKTTHDRFETDPCSLPVALTPRFSRARVSERRLQALVVRNSHGDLVNKIRRSDLRTFSSCRATRATDSPVLALPNKRRQKNGVQIGISVPTKHVQVS